MSNGVPAPGVLIVHVPIVPIGQLSQDSAVPVQCQADCPNLEMCEPCCGAIVHASRLTLQEGPQGGARPVRLPRGVQMPSLCPQLRSGSVQPRCAHPCDAAVPPLSQLGSLSQLIDCPNSVLKPVSVTQQSAGSGCTPGTARPLCRGAEQLMAILGCLFCVLFFAAPGIWQGPRRFLLFDFVDCASHGLCTFDAQARTEQRLCPDCNCCRSCLPANPGLTDAQQETCPENLSAKNK